MPTRHWRTWLFLFVIFGTLATFWIALPNYENQYTGPIDQFRP